MWEGSLIGSFDKFTISVIDSQFRVSENRVIELGRKGDQMLCDILAPPYVSRYNLKRLKSRSIQKRI